MEYCSCNSNNVSALFLSGPRGVQEESCHILSLLHRLVGGSLRIFAPNTNRHYDRYQGNPAGTAVHSHISWYRPSLRVSHHPNGQRSPDILRHNIQTNKHSFNGRPDSQEKNNGCHFRDISAHIFADTAPRRSSLFSVRIIFHLSSKLANVIINTVTVCRTLFPIYIFTIVFSSFYPNHVSLYGAMAAFPSVVLANLMACKIYRKTRLGIHTTSETNFSKPSQEMVFNRSPPNFTPKIDTQQNSIASLA